MIHEDPPFAPRHPDPVEVPPVLLGYQGKCIAATPIPVIVHEKSRRIGASWTFAYEASETASKKRGDGGMDVLYIGYNLDMAREFIEDAAFWSKALHGFAAAFEEFAFDDGDRSGDRSIKAFLIRFASGFKIIALSSRPRSLRGHQGLVIIDEAAFHDDLPGLLKAAMAMLMWGGRVRILSTHEGADNPFNELVEDCRAGRKPYKLLRVTFDDAVRDGLYKRICLVNGKQWTPAAEKQWVAEIRAFYGEDAAEELDVIPSAGAGVWLTRALIDACMNPYYRVAALSFDKEFGLKPLREREAFVDAWLADEIDPLLAGLDRYADSYIGGDFARTGDLTVKMPGQIARGSDVLRVPFSIELRNCPFAQQQQVMFHVIRGLPNFRAGAFDARGLGAQMAEAAADEFGPDRIDQVLATQEWYRENMPPLKARFEDRTIELPRDDDTRLDLRMVKVTRGVPSVPENARARSSRGGQRHGDAAIAAVMLDHATRMDVIDYGNIDPETGNPRLDEGSAWDRDGDEGAGGRFGHMTGAW